MQRISELFMAYDQLKEPWRLLVFLLLIAPAFVLLSCADATGGTAWGISGYAWLALLVTLRVVTNRMRARAAAKSSVDDPDDGSTVVRRG